MVSCQWPVASGDPVLAFQRTTRTGGDEVRPLSISVSHPLTNRRREGWGTLGHRLLLSL